MPNDLTIVTRPMAISAPVIQYADVGQSIAQIVSESLTGHTIGAVMVDLNGYPVERSRWESVVPSAGDHVLIYTTMHGGGGKNPLRTILTLVVIAAAFVATAYVGGAGGWAMTAGYSATTAGVMGAVAGAVVSAAGMLLINAIAPIRPPGITGLGTYAESPTYSIAGARNTANPWGPVPVLLGTHKVFPPYGAKPYTEISGGDEYLRVLLVWGYGPIQVGEIKIGETPLSAYEGVDVETRQGWPNDLPITLFPSQVTQNQVGVVLKEADGWITRTAEPGADELSVDTFFLRGLVEIDTVGNRQSTTVAVETRYREVGAATWIELDGVVNYGADEISVPIAYSPTIKFSAGTNSVYARPDGEIEARAGSSTVPNLVRIGSFVIETEQDPGGQWGDMGPWPDAVHTITSVSDVANANKTGLVCSLDAGKISITSGTATFGADNYTAKTPSMVRYGLSWKVDRTKQYEVSRRRTTADTDDNDRIMDECTWAALRSIRNDNPLNFEHPVAATAIRIKASDQLQGVVDNISAVCTSIVPGWNHIAKEWQGGVPTKNPAALARYALIGPISAKPRAVSQLDNDVFGELYELCSDEGYEFNMYRDFRTGVWDVVADVATAFRGAPAISDGLWSCINDHEDRPIAQHIAPRNSWGFSSEKVLFEAPHAFRVKFKNEENDYEWDEMIVYADGYTSSNATLFEGVEFPGITKPDLIYKMCRYHMAQAILRPEIFSLYMDFEHLACRRGSLVRVNHDVALWGGSAGRVKSLVEEPFEPIEDEGGSAILDEGGDPIFSSVRILGVILDEKVLMVTGTNYACRFRTPSQETILVSVETVNGETNELTFQTPIEASLAPKVGDLAQFGESSRESAELLVKSITRAGDFTARLEMVDYAKDIYDADTGPIPPYDPMTTAPTDIARIAPAAPFIIDVESGTRALEVIGNSVRPRIIVSVAPVGGNVRIGRYKIRHRITGEPSWLFATMEAEGNVSFFLSDVIEGEQYTIQAQAISIWGKESEWSPAVYETVVGESELPSNVTGFRCNIVGADAKLSWNAVTDLDLSHYKIRWSPEKLGATWSESVAVVARVGKDSTSATAPAMVGTYLIKAVDFAGNESETAAAAITNIVRITGLNFVELWEQEHPDWDGVGDNAEESVGLGGIIIEDLSVSDEGRYVFSDGVDLGGVFTSRATASLSISGQDLYADLYDMGNLYAAGNLYGAAEGQYDAHLEMAITDDDPAGAPAWSDWMQFLVGDYTARGYKFSAVLTSLAANVTPILTKAAVEVDMPDRVVEFHASVGTGGETITFDPAFYIAPEIGLSVIDGQEGDKYALSSISASGFTIAFTNSGSPVAREVSGIAKAYGELEV